MNKLRKLGMIAATVALGSALTVAGAGIAAANGAAGPRQQGGAAVHHTRTSSSCISLWAVVNKSGGLVRAGCPGITSAHVNGTGHYQVLFPRNVRACVYVATAGNGGSTDIPPPDFATVAGRLGHTNGVYIAIYDNTGVAVDHGFLLLVECKLPNVP